MFHAIKKGLKAVADFYRVAPFGESVVLINAGFLSSSAATDERMINDIAYLPYWAMSIMGIACGAVLVWHQFRTKKKLEQHLEQYGFDEQKFIKTVPEWCARQTARVVTEKYGCLEDYVALCEKNKDIQQWRDLRNF